MANVENFTLDHEGGQNALGLLPHIDGKALIGGHFLVGSLSLADPADFGEGGGQIIQHGEELPFELLSPQSLKDGNCLVVPFFLQQIVRVNGHRIHVVHLLASEDLLSQRIEVAHWTGLLIWIDIALSFECLSIFWVSPEDHPGEFVDHGGVVESLIDCQQFLQTLDGQLVCRAEHTALLLRKRKGFEDFDRRISWVGRHGGCGGRCRKQIVLRGNNSTAGYHYRNSGSDHHRHK